MNGKSRFLLIFRMVSALWITGIIAALLLWILRKFDVVDVDDHRIKWVAGVFFVGGFLFPFYLALKSWLQKFN